MGTEADLSHGCRRRVEELIESRVSERFEEWFPGHGPVRLVRLERLSSKHRSRVYRVVVGEGRGRPMVFAKVRLGNGGRAAGSSYRPMLTSGGVPAEEQTRIEFEGLSRAHLALQGAADTFATIRPLEIIPQAQTVLMEYVAGTPLRAVLLGQSRLGGDRRSRRQDDLDELFSRAGAWLRLFQASTGGSPLAERQSTRDEVVELLREYGSFLEDRLGGHRVRRLTSRAVELAEDAMPDRLPLAVGHGDYAPRNLMVCADGRLAVFDPLPRWRAPEMEDLCRILVGVRLLGLQLHSHGAAFPRRQVERLERRAIDGFYGARPVPAEGLRCYQLLIMLDKWSALVDRTSGRRGRLRRTSVELATGYLADQAERILDLASEHGPGLST